MEHELAGGLEDWEDISGGDVDRYGFITMRKETTNQASTPEPRPPQRVSTVSSRPWIRRCLCRCPNFLQTGYIVDRLKLTTDRFYKWLHRYLVVAVAWEGRCLHPSLHDLGFIEVPTATFLSSLLIHRKLARLDEVQGHFVPLQTAFLAIEIGGGWMKQVTC